MKSVPSLYHVYFAESGSVRIYLEKGDNIRRLPDRPDVADFIIRRLKLPTTEGVIFQFSDGQVLYLHGEYFRTKTTIQPNEKKVS